MSLVLWYLQTPSPPYIPEVWQISQASLPLNISGFVTHLTILVSTNFEISQVYLFIEEVWRPLNTLDLQMRKRPRSGMSIRKFLSVIGQNFRGTP